MRQAEAPAAIQVGWRIHEIYIGGAGTAKLVQVSGRFASMGVVAFARWGWVWEVFQEA